MFGNTPPANCENGIVSSFNVQDVEIFEETETHYIFLVTWKEGDQMKQGKMMAGKDNSATNHLLEMLNQGTARNP